MGIFVQPFSATSATGKESWFKDSKGRFVSKQYTDKLFGEEAGRKYQEAIKKRILQKYDEKAGSTGWELTGQLRWAIEQGEWSAARSGDRVIYSFEVADLPSGRQGRKTAQFGTRIYSAYFFNGNGEGWITPTHSRYMRFKRKGEGGKEGSFVKAGRVRAFAGYPEVMAMTPEDWKAVNEIIKQEMKEAGNGVLSR